MRPFEGSPPHLPILRFCPFFPHTLCPSHVVSWSASCSQNTLPPVDPFFLNSLSSITCDILLSSLPISGYMFCLPRILHCLPNYPCYMLLRPDISLKIELFMFHHRCRCNRMIFILLFHEEHCLSCSLYLQRKFIL